MSYLPLRFEASDVFPKKNIAVRPGVHIMLSSGTIPDKMGRESGTTEPVFELNYNRKNNLYAEVNRKPVEIRPGYASLGFLGQAAGYAEYDRGDEIELYSIWVSPSAFDGFCEAVCGKSGAGFRSFQKGAYYCRDFKNDAREESIITKLDSCFSKDPDKLNKLLLECYILELLSMNIERLFREDCSGNQLIRLSKTDMGSLIYAREVRLNRLESPPTLLELSRMIHMNDCKLKRFPVKLSHEPTIGSYQRRHPGCPDAGKDSPRRSGEAQAGR
jgi:hypothetical protein